MYRPFVSLKLGDLRVKFRQYKPKYRNTYTDQGWWVETSHIDVWGPSSLGTPVFYPGSESNVVDSFPLYVSFLVLFKSTRSSPTSVRVRNHRFLYFLFFSKNQLWRPFYLGRLWPSSRTKSFKLYEFGFEKTVSPTVVREITPLLSTDVSQIVCLRVLFRAEVTSNWGETPPGRTVERGE